MLSQALLLSLASAVQVAEPRVPRLLVYTVSAGFEHEVVRRPEPRQDGRPVESLAEIALGQLAKLSGRFEAVVSRDPREFEPARLATYDAVLFYTTGELPIGSEGARALLEFVRAGKGFVGVHSATDTFYAVPEYGRMVGGYFDGHPWHGKVRVRVEDQQHPATRHLGSYFEITDEIYQYKTPYDRARQRVLLSLDTASVDLAQPGVNRKDGDFALAWTREEGRGRVFYTALGHQPELWADARFREHLTGGILWVLRDVVATLAPEDQALHAWVRGNPGDPARGSAVFRREGGPRCQRCHSVRGEGGAAGPDLSDLARRRSRDEILLQILAPSARIDAGWEATVFELEDGTSFAGRVRSETPERTEVWDADGRVRALTSEGVRARRTSAVSLMPEGLARTLSREDFADLVAWLGTLQGSD